MMEIRKFPIPIPQFCSYIKLFGYSVAISLEGSNISPEPVKKIMIRTIHAQCGWRWRYECISIVASNCHVCDPQVINLPVTFSSPSTRNQNINCSLYNFINNDGRFYLIQKHWVEREARLAYSQSVKPEVIRTNEMTYFVECVNEGYLPAEPIHRKHSIANTESNLN